jgi:molecular chaperone IbpA
MSTIFDLAPLWRSSIGFDCLPDLLRQAMEAENAAQYPPHDIEQAGEDSYRLTLAVAGWTPDEITVATEPNVLIVSGEKNRT